jgi:DNA-binding response OmpR family regulator
MRIIIVEDDQNKLKQLESLIRKHRPSTAIIVCRSYQSGLSTIISDAADLILLDMSMPTYDQSPNEAGGRKRPFAGKEILRQMARRRISSPVLVITQFTRFGDGDDAISLEELVRDLESEQYGNYLGTISYSAEVANWEAELLAVLNGEEI